VNRLRRLPCIKGSIVFFSLFTIFFFSPIKKATAQDVFIKLKVVAEQANIRLEPDISSIIIRQVPQGTILRATEKKQEWFAVQLTPELGTAISGYVHESLVTAIEPLPEEKSSPVIPKKKEKQKIPAPIPPTIEQEEEQQIFPYKVSLSVLGGGNYVGGGDLNLGIKGLADLHEDMLGIRGKGEINSVHLGYVVGLEVSFPLTQRLSLGIAAEHFQGKNESQVDYSQGTSSSVLLMRPGIRATPVSFFLSFNPVSTWYVIGGFSYYFARCSYTYSFQSDDLTQQRVGKASSRGIGLLGGLGFKKNLSSNLSLLVEITGRLAKIQGFKGKEDSQDSSGQKATEKGTLYLIQAQILEERTHSILFIRETRPSEAGIIDAREAQINLSGISLRLGFQIHF
jgi:hypothetical protein